MLAVIDVGVRDHHWHGGLPRGFGPAGVPSHRRSLKPSLSVTTTRCNNRRGWRRAPQLASSRRLHPGDHVELLQHAQRILV